MLLVLLIDVASSGVRVIVGFGFIACVCSVVARFRWCCWLWLQLFVALGFNGKSLVRPLSPNWLFCECFVWLYRLSADSAPHFVRISF
jgi:hypothetical protein